MMGWQKCGSGPSVPDAADSARLPVGRCRRARACGAGPHPGAGSCRGACRERSPRVPLPQGGLTGGALNRKRALLNAGLACLTGKIPDDAVEERAKAAAAGTAETAGCYIGLAAGAT